MLHTRSLPVWKAISCMVLAAALAPWAASAQDQPCDDNARREFANAVESGATDAELEARFGHCRTAFTEPVCTANEGTKSGLTAVTEESKTVINFNTWYERMNGCGYHPQAEMVACDVEIRQRTGYFPFPGGSFEHVLFCFDCNQDNIFEFATRGFVHVTDSIITGTPSWYHLAYATTFGAPTICTTNNGGQGTVRAILQWFTPPANCGTQPYWGNIINFTVRRDP